MENYEHMKYRRGSSPSPTQNEQDLHGPEKNFWLIEKDPDIPKINTPEKLTAVEAQPDNIDRWQDDGGEGG